MLKNLDARKIFFIGLFLVSLIPFISSGFALFLGILFALTLGNPFLKETKGYSSKLLQVAVIGLGAGMNLNVVLKVGRDGFLYTLIGIGVTFLLGYVLGRLFKNSRELSFLLSMGTAICGGSAIAAAAPVIRAKEDDVSIALAVVFFLNAIALFIFPMIGHELALTQNQFGFWSALAIHDTSSVVGSSMQYGADALQLATVVKLARAIWIIPIVFALGFFWPKGAAEKSKAKYPWFILYFALAAALVTFFPALQPFGDSVQAVAKRVLVATLFLIGANISREAFRTKKFRNAISQGFFLWIFIATATLAAIELHWIQ